MLAAVSLHHHCIITLVSAVTLCIKEIFPRKVFFLLLTILQAAQDFTSCMLPSPFKLTYLELNASCFRHNSPELRGQQLKIYFHVRFRLFLTKSVPLSGQPLNQLSPFGTPWPTLQEEFTCVQNIGPIKLSSWQSCLKQEQPLTLGCNFLWMKCNLKNLKSTVLTHTMHQISLFQILLSHFFFFA